MVGDRTDRSMDILWVGKGILGETIPEERERTSILPVCAVNAWTDQSSWGRAKTNLTFGPMAGSHLVSFPSYITLRDPDKNNMVPIT